MSHVSDNEGLPPATCERVPAWTRSGCQLAITRHRYLSWGRGMNAKWIWRTKRNKTNTASAVRGKHKKMNGGTSHAWSLQKCFYWDNSLEMQGQLDSTVSFLSPFPGEIEFHITIGCPHSFFLINNINGLWHPLSHVKTRYMFGAVIIIFMIIKII